MAGRPVLTPALAHRMGLIWGAWQVCRQRGIPLGHLTVLELAQRPVPHSGKPRIGSWHRDRL